MALARSSQSGLALSPIRSSTSDTTRAITNLLYNGTLAKYPNIRFLMSHMGGVTPFLLFRLSCLDDDPKVLPDPRSPRQPDGVHQRSQLWRPAPDAWTDGATTMKPSVFMLSTAAPAIHALREIAP